MKPVGIAILSIALLALTTAPVKAQYVVSAKSGTLNLTEGQVDLNGQPVESSLTHYPDIKEGNVLRTGEGRAEVLLTPGVTLRLGEHSSLKMITNRLIDTRLELLAGAAVVEADQVSKDTSVTVVVRNAAVSLPKTGIYHFAFDPAQVKVYSGEAAVLIGTETTLVGTGRLCALGGPTAAVEKFNTNDTDALDHWSHRRSELMSMANVSGANSYNSGSNWYSSGGWYGPGYFAGVGGPYGMPFIGCSGLGFSPVSFGFYGSGFWSFNPWYGMYTYIPCDGMAYSPYGYGFWSPGAVQGVVGSPIATSRSPVTRGPFRAPIGGPVRVPLSLAVNGSHTPGSAGARAPGYTSGLATRGGFTGGMFGGSASRGGGGWAGGGSSSVAASHASSSAGGLSTGLAAGTAASASHR